MAIFRVQLQIIILMSYVYHVVLSLVAYNALIPNIVKLVPINPMLLLPLFMETVHLAYKAVYIVMINKYARNVWKDIYYLFK